MENVRAVARRRVQIVNAYGLHVRPATKFVRLAQSFRSDVRVDHQGTRVNGKSLLDMTGLAAECGTTLDLEVEGSDAEQALAALADLVAAGFHMTDEDYLPQSGPTERAEGPR
jgi:phosphocarrier protein